MGSFDKVLADVISARVQARMVRWIVKHGDEMIPPDTIMRFVNEESDAVIEGVGEVLKNYAKAAEIAVRDEPTKKE